MKITSKDFADVLRGTSLTIEERKAIASLLGSLSEDQIKELYKILLKDARETQRILKKYEMQNKKEVLKLKQELNNKKRKKTKK